MRFAFFIVILLVSATATFGQYEPKEYSMPENLNSISLNLTPIAVLLMNGESVVSRYGLAYKRQTDVNKKIRGVINFELRDKFTNRVDPNRNDFSDTTYTVYTESRNYYNSDLRLGIEYFKANKKHSMVYGFDVIAGYSKEFDEFRTTPYYIITDTTGFEYFVPSPFEYGQVFNKTIDYVYFGLDWSIGPRWQVDDHFNLALTWNPEVHYRTPISENYSHVELRPSAPNSEFVFRIRGIEFYLEYLF